MTDRESEFARKVAVRLDRGLADLRPGTLYRLQQARAAALAGAAARVPGVELAAAGAAGDAPRSPETRAGALRWIGLALLVAGLGYGFQQWQAVQQVREFEDIDLHLLASDLPIDAYLDRGFQNWVRTAFEY